MINIDYIQCDGVRVPSDWSVDQLGEALAKRKIRFHNEREIMRVFGEAILLKATLETIIHKLHEEIAKLNSYVEQKKKLAACPNCSMRWMEPVGTTKSKSRRVS